MKEFHKILAPKEIEDWEIYFTRKVDCKIKMEEECPIKYENGQALDVLSWYDDMRNPVPTWYKWDFYKKLLH